MHTYIYLYIIYLFIFVKTFSKASQLHSLPTLGEPAVRTPTSRWTLWPAAIKSLSVWTGHILQYSTYVVKFKASETSAGRQKHLSVLSQTIKKNNQWLLLWCYFRF